MSASIPDPAANDPARTFRIGHRERDEAIEVLRQAAGDGRITVEELDERMEKVQAAKYPVDLDEVLADLTPDLPSHRFRRALPGGRAGTGSALSPARPPVEEEGWDRRDPLVLRATWENVTRRGRWRVPPFIRCEPAASNIELNFLEVATDLPEITVEVSPGVGNVIVVVPDGWGVDVDRLGHSWGSVKTVVNALPDGTHPLIRLEGSIGMGTFKARFANYFDRRRLER
ncbi:uncharacterized protein DUF1707 [Brevibacterium sanguinis]|uniref:Uncharacterized protein DUF1707 n=2 Tax=Brevibacterium TaxID=1696 RepID=A0A366IHD3_9MICO|nr:MULTISPECIES: DUF1707 domain-containing protein [Brevibacterium]RBP63418.1 uncharacterized protein DUF1707 [Brevibacterium sanguinis]RBP69885.1 uncharacterized protein DUF1707 [Brevibacterium celere]